MLLSWQVQEATDVLTLSTALTICLSKQLSVPRKCVHLLWDSACEKQELFVKMSKVQKSWEGKEQDSDCVICGDPEEQGGGRPSQRCYRCFVDSWCQRCSVQLPGGPCCLLCLLGDEVSSLSPAQEERLFLCGAENAAEEADWLRGQDPQSPLPRAP